MLIKRIPNWAAVVFVLVISAFILTMMSLGSGKLTFKLICFSTLVCATLTKAGELSLRASHFATSKKPWLPMAFVAGYVAISLPMVALTLALNISALTSFWIISLLVLCLSYLDNKFPASDSPSSNAHNIRASDWADTVIVLFFALVIGILAKIPVSSPSILFNTGVLPIWSDYFLHGVNIASFGSPFSTGGDMEVAGISHSFYHYATFILPAAFMSVSGMSGLALSTSLLLPLGLLVAALGIYVFATELGGRFAGLFTLTAIISLPAFSIFVQSGWFDFYWLLLITPASGYALGVSTVVCTSTFVYLKKKDSSVLWFTMLLLFSLIMIRVHMFFLLAPTILAVILLHRWRENIRLLLGTLIGIVTVGLLSLHYSTTLHTLWIEFANPHGYLNFALQTSQFDGHLIQIPEYPYSLTLFAQILVVLAAVLGAYLVLYPFMFQLHVRRFGFHAMNALPLILTTCFIGLMLFAPIAPSITNGDFTEFKHRHFLLVYVIAAIYTITFAFILASNRIAYSKNQNKFRWFISGLMICMVAAAIIYNWDLNPARPNVDTMPWAGNFHNQPVTPGLQEAAQYIETHARQGDVMAMGGSSTVSDPRALIVEVVSLTGIPAFVARSDLKMMRSQCVRQLVMKRLSVLQDLSSKSDWPAAKNFLQSNGIRWFLVPNLEKINWDPDRKFAIFSFKEISVYDVEQPPIEGEQKSEKVLSVWLPRIPCD